MYGDSNGFVFLALDEDSSTTRRIEANRITNPEGLEHLQLYI
jgi:hypothetical protein